MKFKTIFGFSVSFLCLLTAGNSVWAGKHPSLVGDYLEVRSCDVYTGSCFANAEMGLSGKEGMLVWSIREGNWGRTQLNGLGVIAVVRVDATLGDLRYQPRRGKALLFVDERGNQEQRQALAEFARSMAGALIAEVVEVRVLGMEMSLGGCSKNGCASVKAGGLIEISTRCLGGKDHVCGNEQVFYPPLTAVEGAVPAFTELAAFRGKGLGVVWESTGQRSAFLGGFAVMTDKLAEMNPLPAETSGSSVALGFSSLKVEKREALERPAL